MSLTSFCGVASIASAFKIKLPQSGSGCRELLWRMCISFRRHAGATMQRGLLARGEGTGIARPYA